MKVEKIAIIVIDNRNAEAKPEDEKDAAALRDKILKARAGLEAMEMGHRDPGGVKTFTVSAKSKTKFEEGVVKEIAAFLAGAKTYGFYLLMHGTAGAPPSSNKVLSPASVAKLVLAAIKPLKGEGKLLKINLVACTFGAPPSFFKNKGDSSYAQDLCQLLGIEDTMVAGYTVPVYVHREGNPEYNSQFGSGGMKPEKGTMPGQKLINPFVGGKPGPDLIMDTAVRLNDGNRAIYKRIWALRNGKAVEINIKEYRADSAPAPVASVKQ